jgi:hypothetical protein
MELPTDLVLTQIPLAEPFQKLSKEDQMKARAIITNKTLLPEAKKVHNLLKTIPVDQTKSIRSLINKQS